MSEASWLALLIFASAPSDVAGLGVNGFGYFCQTTMVALFETHQAKARLPGRDLAPRKTNGHYSWAQAFNVFHLPLVFE
jgi:hypothetical protein